MFEAMVSNHTDKSVPATCATTTQRTPIDSIWTSLKLAVLYCGFLPFHDTHGLHSDLPLVWADVCNEDLLGHRPQHIYQVLWAKARSNDPDVREKFIQRYINRYGKEDIINDFQTLTYFYQKQREEEEERDEIIYLHSSLASRIKKIQLEVDDSLGQFFTGSVTWSPTIQVHCDRIDYWYRILCIKSGVLTSKNAIKKLSIKLGEYSGNYLTALAYLEKLKIACKEYRGAKKEAVSLREAFLEDKIARNAHNRKLTSGDMVKILMKEQRTIQEGFESRQISGKNNKQPVLKAEVIDFITGITKTVYTQEEIVIAAAESNRRHQYQTVGTAFHEPALFDAFEPCTDNEENCLGVLDGTFILHPDADPYAVSLLETMVQSQSLRDKGPIN